MMMRKGGEGKTVGRGGQEEYMNKTWKIGKYSFSGRTLLVLFDNIQKEQWNSSLDSWCDSDTESTA